MTDERLWLQAESMADLCELVARWLEGDVDCHPCYPTPADDETTSLVPALAAINRAGFMTENSQPAAGADMRAWVGGLCTEDVVEHLDRLALVSELIILMYPPDSPLGGVQIPVTSDNGEAFTWVGGAIDAANITWSYGEKCGPGAVAELLTAWSVEVLDPKWGRDDLLWPAVIDALTATDGGLEP